MNKIPKIIHQIWYQGNIPEDYPNFSTSWKKMNPDYEYRLWSEKEINDLLIAHFPHYYTLFNKFPEMIQKIDTAKAMILYIYGGLYVDLDSECAKPIDEIINNNEIVLIKSDINYFVRLFIFNTSNEIIQNGFMASNINNDFWLHYIESIFSEDINKKSYETKEQWIQRVTGPANLTRAYNSYNNKNKIKIIDPEYFDPIQACDYDYYKCDLVDCKTKFPNAFAFHHYGSKHSTHGWSSDFAKNINNLFCRNRSYLYLISFILCIIIILIFCMYIRYVF